jgi:diketogulonate reductase-like aldo/keto reductase
MKKNFEFYNGVKIPSIGFGTWQIPEGRQTYSSVLYALKAGYRHIDTAYAYGNESSVGKAVRDSGISRNEIFITSKLPAEIKSYDGALKYFEKTMQNLDLDYVDLYLIHAPWPWTRIGEDHTEGNIQAWKGMEEIYRTGKAKAVGISNFNVKDMNAILDTCKIRPMANQIKFFIGHIQEEITEFCREHEILVEGYSPLATGRILDNEMIMRIAEKDGVTLPQICVRYVLQKDVLPLPKSVHPEYIKNNAEIDFEIDEEDMHYLDNLKELVKQRW